MLIEETYRRAYTKEKPEQTNIKDVVVLLRGMIRQEPKFSLRHLLSSCCLQFWMKYFTCKFVQDFYAALFDPNDMSMNIPIDLRESLYKYAYETGLMVNMTYFMLHPAEDTDLTKIFTRKYTYPSHAEIAKITEPYLYEEAWSAQE